MRLVIRYNDVMTKYWPMDKAMEAIAVVVMNEALCGNVNRLLHHPTVKNNAVMRLYAPAKLSYDREYIYVNGCLFAVGASVHMIVVSARFLLKQWEREGLL